MDFMLNNTVNHAYAFTWRDFRVVFKTDCWQTADRSKSRRFTTLLQLWLVRCVKAKSKTDQFLEPAVKTWQSLCKNTRNIIMLAQVILTYQQVILASHFFRIFCYIWIIMPE